MEAIDTTNKFLVGATAGSGRIQIMMPPRPPLSPEDALNLAAWLVALRILPVAIEFADTEGIERTLFMSRQTSAEFR
jgi:hypothetical protein